MIDSTDPWKPPTVDVAPESRSAGRRPRRRGKEVVGRQGRGGCWRRAPDGHLAQRVRLRCQELYDIIRGHTALNNYLYESIVPRQILPMQPLPIVPPPPLEEKPRGEEDTFTSLTSAVCAVGATACLHRRWPSGTAAKWSSQPGGCRTCEAGRATRAPRCCVTPTLVV